MLEITDTISTLLDDVEEKGNAFLDTLLESNIYEVAVGKVKIWYSNENQAHFALKDKLPLWYDVTLIPKAAPNLEVGIGLGFAEYELRYNSVREQQLAAANNNQILGLEDAIEALLLAVLVKDEPVVESLITRLGTEISGATERLLPLLDRGNSRIRSAIGRSIALTNQEDALNQLLEWLRDESAEGVRADIIMTYIQVHAVSLGIPAETVEQWLGSTELVDILSFVTAFSSALGTKLPNSLLEKVNPNYRIALATWFE